MSVRVMSWVWQSSRSKGTDRLVLLAIADCAADDGSNAYPSMAALVDKTGLSERAVQAATKRLDKLGELKVYLNKGPRGCNRYRVIMATPASAAPPHDVHPAADAPPQEMRGTPHEVHPTPAADAPGTVLEPSVEPTHPPTVGGTRAGARARPDRGTRIPDDFTVTPAMVTWARTNVPDVDGRLATAKFLDHWRAATGTNATKRDWVAAWRNWMRNEADRPRTRASPARGQRVERGNLQLRPDTAAELDDIARFAAMDAQRDNGTSQHAIGGPP